MAQRWSLMQDRPDERQRRAFAATDLQVIARGGAAQVVAATGMSRNTAIVGTQEPHGSADDTRPTPWSWDSCRRRRATSCMPTRKSLRATIARIAMHSSGTSTRACTPRLLRDYRGTRAAHRAQQSFDSKLSLFSAMVWLVPLREGLICYSRFRRPHDVGPELEAFLRARRHRSALTNRPCLLASSE